MEVTADLARWCDLTTTGLAVIALVGAIAHRPAVLPGAARAFLAVTAAYLLARALPWLWPERGLEAVMIAPAIALPVTGLLMVEALLRRHAPIWLKLSMLVGTVMLLGCYPLGVLTTPAGAGLLGAFGALSYVALLLFLLQRDRDSLSAAENQRALAMIVALALAAPLGATDLRFVTGFPPVSLAALAGPVLAYALVRAPHGALPRWRVVRELGLIALAAIALTAAVWVFAGGDDLDLLTAAASLSLGFVFTAEVLRQLANRRQAMAQTAHTAWLQGTQPADAAGFLRALQGLDAVEDGVLLMPRELKRYDLGRMLPFLQAKRRPIALSELRALLDTTTDPKERVAAEQLVDLLLSRKHDHVCTLRLRPLTLLLVNLPATADGARRYAELSTVLKLAELGERPATAPAEAVPA